MYLINLLFIFSICFSSLSNNFFILPSWIFWNTLNFIIFLWSPANSPLNFELLKIASFISILILVKFILLSLFLSIFLNVDELFPSTFLIFNLGIDLELLSNGYCVLYFFFVSFTKFDSLNKELELNPVSKLIFKLSINEELLFS